VTQGIVDRLEIVEIDEQRRERHLVAAGANQRLIDTVEDQCPVRQPGQRVVGGEECELSLPVGELLKILRWLNPASSPRIAMGVRASGKGVETAGGTV